MLLIDSRIGSNDLLQLVRPWGIDAELTTLDYADCAFVGNGPDDRPVQVGIELKKLADLLQCISTGRLAGHQLPGMLQQYDEIWLIAEGVWRAGTDGILEVHRGKTWQPVTLGPRRYMYRDLEHYLTTIEVCGGVRLRRAYDRHETARIVASLYTWWTSKDYDEHKAHLTFDRSGDAALLVRPSLLRRMAAELPGIGYEKSARVAKQFRTVHDMVNAPEGQWQEIDGVGKTLSKRIVDAINGAKT